MEAQELPEVIRRLRFIRGAGNYEKHEACIMSAAVALWRFEHGEDLGRATDELECVCPTIRSYCIRLNDSKLWENDAERTAALMPYLRRIIGTRGSPGLQRRRAFIAADFAVRKILPAVLRVCGREGDAVAAEALPEIVDPDSAIAARDATRKIRDAAYADASAAAYATAYAYAYAAAAAAAAYAAAYAYAYAADAAAYAAADAAYAAAAADATAYAYAYAEKLLADIRSVCKPLALELLDKLCDAKEAA